MGLEVATYINELNVNWPVPTDKIREGDDHLRVIKTALVNSFPNIGGAVELSHTQLNLLPDYLTAFIQHLFPVGGIIAWSGAINTIPAGWVLCDGANGTPDLRNRFIVGAGSTYAVGATGGATSVTSSSTSISLTIQGTALTTAQIPSHDHLIAAAVTANDTPTNTNYLAMTRTEGSNSEYNLKGTNTPPTVLKTSSTGGASTHTHSVSQTAHTHSVNTLPPYYALCWIMKTLAWTEPS